MDPTVSYVPMPKKEWKLLVERYGRWRKFEFVGRRLRKRLLADRFFVKLGRLPDWKRPRRFTDKIQWMKWRGKLERLTPLVDKLQVKEIVAELIGAEHVLEPLRTWTSPEEFRFADLPSPCALKPTHTSGRNLLVPDASALVAEEVEATVRSWFAIDYELLHLEAQYRGVRPVVIAEPFVDIAPNTIFDFKFFCLDGEVAAIQAICYGDETTHKFYDTSWKPLGIGREDIKEHPEEIPAPECLAELIEATRKLSRGFPFVRLDWMVVGAKWYFGEFTFCPTNGLFRFVPDSVDLDWGSRFPLRPYRNPFEERAR
jgi:hypothetical protein